MYQPPPGGPPHEDARTMPVPPQPPPPRRSRIPALALGAYAAGLADLMLAAVTLALLLAYRSQASAQLHQVRAALTTTQSRLAKAQADQASKYTKLSGQMSSLGNALAPYDMICSTDLQGQNGPAQYWFACAQQKP